MSEDKTQGWRVDGPFDPEAAGKVLGSLGHGGFLGMRYGGHGTDWFEAELPWREELVGAGGNGVLASGPIISLFDNCTAMAIWTRRQRFVPHVTLDLRIDYVRGLAHDGDTSDPVAHAAGIFMATGDAA